jgi:hypothetical protein
MQSMIVGNKNGLRPDKRILVLPVTRLDHAIVNEGEGWVSVNRLEIGTNVFKVKHVGRHTFAVGETIQAITFDKEPAIIEIVGCV